ncbi:putative mutator-like element [Rosellinia necatrix]|uniref:Putative mutator-like element n=1 Tax=Rosellinia necatrix TaxID=77044 RepID=A0A1S7UHF3_ROSNE|nr:putative mutator-like element [Rosellinia necatrix]
MSSLGQPGSSNHSHPGLAFPQVNTLRRNFHTSTPPKPSPTPPYQPQQYSSQQPPQTYSHHLFPNTTPSPVPNVASVPNLSNGPSRHTPVQTAQHAQAAVQAVRQHQQHQRGAQQRQMPPQPGPSTSMAYLQQAMNQPPQQVPQQQVQIPQQVAQPVQQLPHAQAIQQQVQPVQPVQTQPVQQVQQNEGSLIPQNQSHHQPHSQPRPQPPQHTQHQHQQVHSQSHHQVHQQPVTLQPQPTPQPQAQPLPPPQPEANVTSQDPHQDDDMEVDSPGDSGEGDDRLTPKLLDGTPFIPRSPMGATMSAPPEGGSFASLEAIHRYVLEYCTSVGYAVVIGRSKKTVPGLKKVLFVCDRAGKPPSRVSPEQRKRKTSSRKCNCPFGFFAIEQRTQWTIRYRPDQAHLQHNHGPSESPLLHPAARKLDSKMVAAVKSLKESGIGVTQTLEILQQQNPHVPLLPRDIYNARAAINRNPQKVEAGIAEERPAIYSKPPPTAEERIRSDLRRELARAKDELEKVQEQSKKEIEELKEKLREKDKMITRFEMFIDICNERVMVQRERLNDTSGPSNNDGVPTGN